MFSVRLAAAVLAGVFLLCSCSRQEEQPLNTALKYAVEGEWRKADKPSEEALKKTPDNINALILRALVCERLDRYDEAVENAYKAASIDSSSFTAVYTLGRLYARKSSRRVEAVNYLIKANRLKSDHADTLVLLSNLQQPGRKSSYLNALSLLPEYAKSPELAFEICMDRAYRGDHKGTAYTLIRLFNENPRDPNLSYAIGGYFYFCDKKRHSVAKAAYQRYMAFPEKVRSPRHSANASKRLAVLK